MQYKQTTIEGIDPAPEEPDVRTPEQNHFTNLCNEIHHSCNHNEAGGKHVTKGYLLYLRGALVYLKHYHEMHTEFFDDELECSYHSAMKHLDELGISTNLI